MTKTIQLRALRSFPYGKHRLAVGEVFDVNEKLGAVFIHEGRAAHPEGASPNTSDLPVEVMVRASKREPITEVNHPAVVKRGAKVDELGTISADEADVLKEIWDKNYNAPAEAVEDEAPKPKRAYRRRDMMAEYGLTGAYKPSES